MKKHKKIDHNSWGRIYEKSETQIGSYDVRLKIGKGTLTRLSELDALRKLMYFYANREF